MANFFGRAAKILAERAAAVSGGAFSGTAILAGHQVIGNDMKKELGKIPEFGGTIPKEPDTQLEGIEGSKIADKRLHSIRGTAGW